MRLARRQHLLLEGRNTRFEYCEQQWCVRPLLSDDSPGPYSAATALPTALQVLKPVQIALVSAACYPLMPDPTALALAAVEISPQIPASHPQPDCW